RSGAGRGQEIRRMTRPMPECSVTRRKSAAHIADIAEVFLVSVKDGLRLLHINIPHIKPVTHRKY
ncbi:MAG TPA: hypothetical protein VND19_23645, partial [Acetobacteraceae bacterium]|nr:hypothetical protein [Acetobacteraceae bacterium]